MIVGIVQIKQSSDMTTRNLSTLHPFEFIVYHSSFIIPSTMIQKINRRNFIKISGLTGTGLILSFPLIAQTEKKPTFTFEPNGFLKIGADNSILIFAKNPEIGQGVKTSLPMIIAEELEVDWEQIEVQQANYKFDKSLGSQFAGGSTAIKDNWESLRKVGASAKEMLIKAAANQWEITIENCYAQSGKVFNRSNKEVLTYGEIAEAASRLTIPEKPVLKDPKDFKIIGTAKANVDSRAIATGQPIFGLDAKPKGMLTAAIVKCPVFGGTIKHIQSAAALAVPGVEQVVEISAAANPTQRVAGVAVIAKNTWAAFKGKNALQVEWDLGEGATESSIALQQQMNEKTSKVGEIQLREDGNITEALKHADKLLEATYEVPFLYHATMEPMNYIADVKADSIECWGSTQVPSSVSYYANKITGIPRENIKVYQARTGGGFGRRLTADYASEAIYLSHKIGKPVQIIWTREEDLQHDYYRPMGMYKLKGGLDKSGNITAWHINAATTSRYLFRKADVSPHGTELFPDGFPAGFIPNFKMEYSPITTQVSTGAWRAPGHNATCFVDQSFLDELVVAADKDPIDFRLALLGEADKEMPYDDHGGPTYLTARLKNVIKKVAALSNWNQPAAKGIFRGFAAHFMFGAYVAEVIEISLGEDNRPIIEKVYAVVDCGIVVNKLGALAQIEGGIIDGLSATIYGGITIQNGRVVQSNFHDYPMLRLPESPEVIVELIDSQAHPEGLGEISLPTVSAALCNAIFRATGKRIRQLPLKNSAVFS